MGLRTGRANAPAVPEVDAETCTLCGLCAIICPGMVLELEDERVAVHQERLFGCIGCGQCLTVCPSGAIRVTGRDLNPEDVLELAPVEARADYPRFLALLRARRSVRRYAAGEVEREDVERILEATSSAPMGLPPSDVEVLVFHGRERLRSLAAELIPAMNRLCRAFRPPWLSFVRPFLGHAVAETMSGFVVPVVDLYVRAWAEGRDLLFYDAPLGFYFHASPYADPADPLVAATYAMLAAESLGLGTCMLGMPGHGFKRSRQLGKKYGVSSENHPGIFLVAGHPAIHHRRGLRRRFSRVHWA